MNYDRDQKQTNFANLTNITDVEIDVLRLIAAGYTKEVIAYKLGYSEDYIKNLLSGTDVVEGLYKKLRVGNKTEAVVTAAYFGLINLEEIELATPLQSGRKRLRQS